MTLRMGFVCCVRAEKEHDLQIIRVIWRPDTSRPTITMSASRILLAAMCLTTASAFMAPASLKLGSPSAIAGRCALAPALRQVGAVRAAIALHTLPLGTPTSCAGCLVPMPALPSLLAESAGTLLPARDPGWRAVVAACPLCSSDKRTGARQAPW